MSSLSDLLNPAPASGPASPKLSSEAPNRASGDAAHVVARTTYDAASALTALAHASSSANGFQAQHSPTASYASYPAVPLGGNVPSRRYSDARPGSTYGIVATPVEPSPPIERSEQPISPTLEQYHHGSRSPREQRRHSLQSKYSPPPRLAPIQAHAPLRSEQVNQERSIHKQETSELVSAPSFLPGSESRKRSMNEIFAPLHASHDPAMDPKKQPSPAPVDSNASLLQPNAAAAETASASSPITHIKPEPSATPRENTPASAPVPVLDDETLKAVEALKNEHGLRGSAPRKQSSPSIPAMPAESKPNTTTTTNTTRKRPAPKSATKKGTASAVKKPPTKKRKVDPTATADAASPTVATPTSAHLPTGRSATPTSRSSKAGTNRARTGTAASSSPAPRPSPRPAAASSPSSSAAAADDSAATDDNERYCICRRPDNHTWMIACDGGCDDWFHGGCVAIAEADGDLIDTYICPNCERAGRGSTTWKAMCRREGCRRPARVGGVGGGGGRKGRGGGGGGGGGERSKYCSEECGVRFFRERLGFEDRDGLAQVGKGKRGRRKSNFTDTVASVGEDDEDVGSRGGALRVSEVAALVDAVPDLVSFRALGEGVLSPPATVVEQDGGTADDSPDAFLTAAETQSLAHIASRKEALRARHALLKEREKFITTCKEQHGRIAEREGVDMKNICGYDARLSWGDEQFRAWSEAQKQLKQAQAVDGDAVMANGDVGVDGEGGGEVCMKKKCTRHTNWKQLVLQDVRFEVADVGDEMRRVDKEEREIRERAVVRWREKVNGGGDSAKVEIVGDAAEANAMHIEAEPMKENNVAADMANNAVNGNTEGANGIATV